MELGTASTIPTLFTVIKDEAVTWQFYFFPK